MRAYKFLENYLNELKYLYIILRENFILIMNNIDFKNQKDYAQGFKMKPQQNLKKYRSAYILFSLDRRNELKKKYPEYGNPELTKMIAAEWKTSDISQKQIYYLKEKEEKLIFEQIKRDNQIDYKYNKNENYKKPLRFRTPYMFYIMDHKLYLNNKDKYQNIEFIKKLSEKWKAMTIAEKQPYIDKSNSDKKRYELDWENYIKSFFKIKKKNIKKKEKTEKMILDLLKICNNNQIFHSHLTSVWNKLNSKGDINQIYNQNRKMNKNLMLKRLIFRIEKVPRVKEEIKFERTVTEENVFSKFIKEEIDEDSNQEFFEIDDMMDMIVRSGNNANSKEHVIKEDSDQVLAREYDLLIGKKRNSYNSKY
jgi:hypothetical protein